MKRGISWLCVLGCAGIAAAAEAPQAEPWVIKAGAMDGSVLAMDGRSPVAGALIVLKDAESAAEVARATSDEDGSFRFAELAPGSYTLEVLGQAAGSLRVAEDGTVSSLRVIVPQAEAGGAPEGNGNGGAGGFTTTQWVIVGVGATLVIVPAALVIAEMADDDAASP